MAKPEYAETAKQDAEAIRKGRERHPDIRLDLREVDLSLAHLWGTDLMGAEFSGANLVGANMEETDLSLGKLRGVDLDARNLGGSQLSQANLIAKFRGADIREENLTSAVLSRADVRGAKSFGSHIHRADLGEANFQEAQMIWGTFADVDLSLAKALDAVRHLGPSTIGSGTLYNSRGKIPDTFLRGCALSDGEIAAAKLYSRDPGHNKIEHVVYTIAILRNGGTRPLFSAFIPCSNDDLEFAHDVHDALQRKRISCWLDEFHSLSEDNADQVVARRWDRVLRCASQHSLMSSWVDRKVDHVLETEWHLLKERGKRARALVLLNVDSYLSSGEWKSDQAWQITSRLVADFTDWKQTRRDSSRNWASGQTSHG